MIMPHRPVNAPAIIRISQNERCMPGISPPVREVGEPDHDVQAKGKHDVHGDDYHRIHQVHVHRVLQEDVDGREQERDHDQDRRERELPEPRHRYSPPPCTAERSPSRPRGRKTSTRIRTLKITIGVQVVPMYWSDIALMTPIRSPPTTAPVRFPIPPRTAAVNA